MLSELTQEVQKEAGERGVTLRAVYAPRTRRHMLTAHDLANGARKGRALPELLLPHADVPIEQPPALPLSLIHH